MSLGFCSVIFLSFVVSASRKPSLISFNGITGVHSILQTPRQWNLTYYGYFSTCFPHSPVSYLRVGHASYISLRLWWLCLTSSGLCICWINEWMSNKAQNKMMRSCFCLFVSLFFPFHSSPASWEAPEYPASSTKFYVYWHSFLQVQWKSQMWTVCGDENVLFFQNKQKKPSFACLGRNQVSLQKCPVYI